MLLLLPPSETKRDGGDPDSALDLAALGFADLTGPRKTALASLKRLSRNLSAAMNGLRLGPTQRFEIDRNRLVTKSAVMPALDRYTGVLYDALGADRFDAGQREFASAHLAIHSALFGLVRASDPIPAYRLSHDSRLPGVSLRRLWREPIAEVLAARPGVILDLRSESYAALGPAPHRENSLYVRVVTESPSGQRTALSHFNKQAKGEFTSAVIRSGIAFNTVESLLEWAASTGFALSRGAAGELDLVV